MTVIKYTSDDIEILANRVLGLLPKFDGTSRVIVAVAGIPGSGKSTVTSKLMDYLSTRTNEVVLLPQDGFHYYRKELAAMPDCKHLMDRRGAPFTFNVARFVDLLSAVKYDLQSEVLAPSFSHALKDPVENAIAIKPEHKVVILEGNYVNLTCDEWSQIGKLTDEKWMVICDFEVARRRLTERHFEAGICSSLEEAAKRAENNDLVNARFILDNSSTPDVIVQNN